MKAAAVAYITFPVCGGGELELSNGSGGQASE